MRSNLTQHLACPACRRDLRCDADGAEEVGEGWLRCTGCRADYPIVLGVAILVPSVVHYLRLRWDEIERCAAELARFSDVQISGEMRSWVAGLLRGAAGVRARHEGWDQELPWITARYVWAHHAPEEPDLGTGWWGRAFGEYGGADNPYGWVEARISQASLPDGPVIAADVGASVGGMTRRLALDRRFAAVIGLDLAFRPVLVARRLLLGEPVLLRTFECEMEEGEYEARVLPPPVTDGRVDLVVGDATALPFRDGSLGCATSLNLVDVLPDAEDLFREIDRVVGGRGIVALADPYVWRLHSPDSVHPPIGETGPDLVRRHLVPAYDILAEEREVPWLLRTTRREWQVYLCDCLLARRR